ncbi:MULTISPECIES: Bcr/CflA family efflux MFS transporter [unclassified Francisella]|uniref:Bcr/CflA family efflux MFS transporter n=1 Tax=unclassified Francisella TaxID=2610885 RepID=UPI002E371CD4|nr:MULTISPECIES: Bcr/CflA family efflux MFS transporter [unclassified Francisella]MED7820409.1 Bcr/CflA family efflux MFS transporter [Francisella sp. 19S2-4]MED7831244.1 Bcr/CflA family efflux MFS transporter [Francisella sp. 19S2-10]
MIKHSKKLRHILFITIFFVTIGQLCITLYLPSLPAIAKSLSINVGLAQSSITIFLLAYGISQLFYGFLSDYFGRKPCLLIGYIILILATILLLLFSHNSKIFFISRFFQGIGAGAAAVLARAVIRDSFSKNDLPSAFAILIMVVSITPAIAPFIGGLIASFFNWQMIFASLLIYMIIITLAIIYFLPETHSRELSKKKNNKSILYVLKDLFFHEQYLLCVFMIIFIYSSQILYLAISPFIFEKKFHLSEAAYGTLIMIPAFGYILGNFLVHYLRNSVRCRYQILIGIACALTSSIGIIIIGLTGLNLIILLGLLFILTVGLGLTFSNTVALSLIPFTTIAGTAAAVSGFLQISGTSLINAIINFLHIESTFGLGVSLFICTFITKDC